jgi:hypothetical protein
MPESPQVQFDYKLAANIGVLQAVFFDQKHQRLTFEPLHEVKPLARRTAPYVANFRLNVCESRVRFALRRLKGQRWNRPIRVLVHIR